MSRLSDHELMARLVRGEGEALETLMDRHRVRLEWSVTKILRDAHAAEDIVQDAFLVVFLQRESYEPKWAFYTWLHRIAINRALNALRNRKVRREDPLGCAWESVDATALPDDVIMRRELYGPLWRATEALPKRQRRAVLQLLDGASHPMIARDLGCSLPNLRMVLWRARLTIRSAIGQDQKQRVPA